MVDMKPGNITFTLNTLKLLVHNDLNGKQIYNTLIKHDDVWSYVFFENHYPQLEFLIQSDNDGYPFDLSTDTLYILPKKGKEKELLKISSRWKTDSITKTTVSSNKRLLKILGNKMKNRIVYSFWWD